MKNALVVLLLVALLMISGVMIYSAAEKRRAWDISSCTATQHFVDIAAMEFASKHNLTNGSSVKMIDILPYLPSGCSTNSRLWKECRVGGVITVGKVGESPSCSIHGSLLK